MFSHGTLHPATKFREEPKNSGSLDRLVNDLRSKSMVIESDKHTSEFMCISEYNIINFNKMHDFYSEEAFSPDKHYVVRASSLSDLAKPSSGSWPNSCYAV
jgi:hypothetical protein